MGQDLTINVARAHGFADIAPRHKSQQMGGGGPARNQSRICRSLEWLLTGEEEARLRSVLNPWCGAGKR